MHVSGFINIERYFYTDITSSKSKMRMWIQIIFYLLCYSFPEKVITTLH